MKKYAVFVESVKPCTNIVQCCFNEALDKHTAVLSVRGSLECGVSVGKFLSHIISLFVSLNSLCKTFK